MLLKTYNQYIKENREGGEIYQFRGIDYVIQHENPNGLSAYKIIETEDVELDELTPEEVKLIHNPFNIKDKKLVDNADTSNPIILAEIDGMMILIDGTHRNAKALSDNKGIKAYILSKSQTKRIETDSIDPMAEMLKRK